MTSIVTGQQYYIGAGSYRATVTGLGAGLRELVFGAQPVIDGYGADELPPGGAGQLLAPWPNRVDAGRYVPTQRVRHRRRPADPRARRDDHAYLGYSGIPQRPPPEEG